MKKALVIIIVVIGLCLGYAIYANQLQIASGLAGALPIIAYKIIDMMK